MSYSIIHIYSKKFLPRDHKGITAQSVVNAKPSPVRGEVPTHSVLVPQGVPLDAVQVVRPLPGYSPDQGGPPRLQVWPGSILLPQLQVWLRGTPRLREPGQGVLPRLSVLARGYSPCYGPGRTDTCKNINFYISCD